MLFYMLWIASIVENVMQFQLFEKLGTAARIVFGLPCFIIVHSIFSIASREMCE